MYGIFTYIWVIYGVNVGKYSMHGSYGIIIYIYIYYIYMVSIQLLSRIPQKGVWKLVIPKSIGWPEFSLWNLYCLVVDLALWKMMEWKSVGMDGNSQLNGKKHVPNHQPVNHPKVYPT